MSATRNGVKDDLPEVEADMEGAGTSAHAKSEESMTSNKIAIEVHRYSNVIDDEWLHIFSKLDPEAKTIFSRTSDGWHDLVARERPEFLSKAMAPILAETLPQEALLKSRELCRSWTTELNHHLQGDQFQIRQPFEISVDRGTERDEDDPERLINIFRSSEDIKSFLKDMEGHTGNPFPGGTIELWFDIWKAAQKPSNRHIGMAGLDLIREEFWTNSVVLLQEFGSHISYFRFHKVNDPNQNTRAMAENLRDCLLHLPNLKRLSLEGWLEVSPASELDVMQDWLTRNPLPLLPNLVMFGSGQQRSGNAHHILRNAVLDNCLIRANMKVMCFSGLPDQLLNFVNLEVIKFDLDLQDLERLGNLAQRPPLRELILDSTGWTPTPVAAHQLFRALEPFGNTLTHLVLKDFSDLDLSRWMSTHINLPNLKELSLPYFTGSLDPLIQLTTLAVLRLANRDPFEFDDPIEEGSIVEFSGFRNRLYDSNIWQLIPSIESIDDGLFIYERRYLGRLSGVQDETSESGTPPETSD